MKLRTDEGVVQTQPLSPCNSLSTPVDTRFIIMNATTYPNFLAFLTELDIDTVDTKVILGVCRDEEIFE